MTDEFENNSDYETSDESEQIGEKSKGETFWQYFQRASKKISGGVHHPQGLQSATDIHHGTNKKRVQEDLHFCLVCHKTISRGNKASKQRHAASNHKNDSGYNFSTSIVPINHQAAVAAKKKKEDNTLFDTEEVMEIEHSSAATPAINENNLQSAGSSIESDTHTTGCDHGETATPIERTRPIQSTLNFPSEQAKKNCDDDLSDIKYKLDKVLERMQITPENQCVVNSETEASVQILRESSCLSDIDGSGFNFYPDMFGGGIVRCEACFDMICDSSPALLDRDPLQVQRKIEKSPGNSLGAGLIIPKEKVEKLMTGGNQPWYSFKSMMLEHASCTTRNGGNAHYKALIAKKRRRVIRERSMDVLCNQLKSALLTVKIKSASLHYENVIGLVHSCGADVGNLGHGRNQMKAMVQAFECYLHKQLREILMTPLPSTELPPHFGTASDKSTPIHVSNHAIMILVMVNGQKTAIPVDAPPVYSFSETGLEGGTAEELAEQVISAIVKTLKLPNNALSLLMSHQADGQYQARGFLQTLKSSAQGENEKDLPVGHDIFFVIPWDTAHWMDLCMVDIRENSKFLQRFIKRANQFNTMFGRGKGHAEYQGFAKQSSLKAHVTKVFATTRFASSAFSQFESVYDSYEALCKAFSDMRETDDEDEEMKYKVKGRDFCLDLCGVIDILSKPMEMMIKAQSLDQYLWSVTKWWPKVKTILLAMKRDLNRQLSNIQEVTVQKELFPKLNEHYEDLNKEDSEDCVFKGVQLLPGWMVVDTTEQIDSIFKTKSKVIEWSDRSVGDCLKDLTVLCENITDGIEARYATSVSKAAHVLGCCLHLPDVLSLVQGLNSRPTARQVAARDAYGNVDFRSFYTYVCTLSHIKRLAEEEEELKLLPALSNRVYCNFKDVVFQVVWGDLGGCRKHWFHPVKGKHSEAQLKEFRVTNDEHEIDEKFVFTYEDGVCTARLDQATAFSTFYTNEAIYQAAGKEFCIALDVALAMSGSEAVVESYYSVMNTQSKAGGQLNDTLTQRTNVDWCFPMPLQCEETIKEVASLYLDGDKKIGLPRHQIPVFVDERGRALNKYFHGSKVLDRLASRTDYFVLNEKDRHSKNKK